MITIFKILLAITLVQADNECPGCEEDGSTFCNYDDGDSGTCELCSSFSTADDCLWDGLPDDGAEDC